MTTLDGAFRHRRRLLVAIAAVALLAPPPRARAVTWRNHVDPSRIREIVVRDGSVWAATGGGLLRFDPATGRFRQSTNADGLPSNELSALVFAPDGTLWIGTDDIGVARLDVSGDPPRVLRAYNQQIDGLADNAVRTLAVWGDDIVYGTDNGMGLIRNGFPGSPWLRRDGLPDDRVLDVLPVGDFVWIATDSGLVVLDRFGLIRPIAGAPPEANVLGTDGGRVWVGTDNGVVRFDPADSSWTSVGLDQHTFRQIHALFWDGATMWAGDRTRVWRWSGSGTAWTPVGIDTFTLLYELRGSTTEVRGLAVDPSTGDVFAGVSLDNERRGANLIRLAPDGRREVLRPDAPGGSDVLRLSVDVDGAVWASFATYYAGKLETDGHWVNYNGAIPESDSLSSRFTNLTCLADSRGTKWFCTLSTPASPSPLDRLDDGLDADYGNDVWRHAGIGDGGGDGLGSLRLQRAREDPAGNVWFLSDAEPTTGVPAGWWGIQIHDPVGNAWVRIDPATEPRMPDGDVVDVAFAGGFVYLALREFGVQPWVTGGYDFASLADRSDDQWGTPLRVGQALGQIDGRISAIVLRSDNVLWIGTDNGLYKWERQSFLTRIGAFTGLSPGLLSPQVNALALDADENLWVATSRGLNRIARDDDARIDAWSTAAEYQRSLAALRYPLDVISPLADAECRSLAVAPGRDVIYVGTRTGLSVFDFSPAASRIDPLAGVYAYPNPVRRGMGDEGVRLGGFEGRVDVDVYTLGGQRVAHVDDRASGDVVWDLFTASGLRAAPGVYVLRIRNGAASTVRRVAIVR